MLPTLKITCCSRPPQLSLPTAHTGVANYQEVIGRRKEWDKSRCVQVCLHVYFSKNCFYKNAEFYPYQSSDNVVWSRLNHTCHWMYSAFFLNERNRVKHCPPFANLCSEPQNDPSMWETATKAQPFFWGSTGNYQDIFAPKPLEIVWYSW